MNFRLFIPALIMIYSHIAMALEEPILVRHYQHQERYNFGQELLQLALSNINKPYKVVPPTRQAVNEARGELQVINGELDLQWLSTSSERENKLIPIRIPVYRGLLGLRLLLVKKENHNTLSQVKTIEDLRQYTGGHGQHWQDLPVYAANQLPVKAYGDYDALFRQLTNGHFDYFHRGINEIWPEQKRFQDSLQIADNVMLFYAHPVYFFVSKHRPVLARDLEKGLRKTLKEGTFKQLFLQHHQHLIKQGNLSARHLIRLKNPTVPDNYPIMDTKWWLPKGLIP